MSDLLLTAAERERFAAWLEHEAVVDEQMAAQAESLAGLAGVVLAKQNRTEALAARVVARKLRSIEDMTTEAR